jgi:hypothetical protein
MPPELRRRGTGPRATSSKDGRGKKRKGLGGGEEAGEGGAEDEGNDSWMWATGKVGVWPSIPRSGVVVGSEDELSTRIPV